MIVLFKENDKLLVKCKVNLKRQIQYQNKVFKPNTDDIQFLNQEEVIRILEVNGNIRIWNGKKFVKLNLGQFTDIIEKNQYRVEMKPVPEVKKEVPKYQPKPQQQKAEPVVKQQPAKVEQKVEPVKPVEQPKKEEPKEQPKAEPVVKQPEVNEPEKNQEDDNKKKRHNKNQGGEDK
jgi:protein TonB